MLSTLPEPVQLAYRAYARGDRSDEARAAKSTYMRERRAQAAMRRYAFELLNPGEPYTVDGITHGIGGYTNEGCRCGICTRAWRGLK